MCMLLAVLYLSRLQCDAVHSHNHVKSDPAQGKDQVGAKPLMRRTPKATPAEKRSSVKDPFDKMTKMSMEGTSDGDMVLQEKGNNVKARARVANGKIGKVDSGLVQDPGQDYSVGATEGASCDNADHHHIASQTECTAAFNYLHANNPHGFDMHEGMPADEHIQNMKFIQGCIMMEYYVDGYTHIAVWWQDPGETCSLSDAESYKCGDCTTESGHYNYHPDCMPTRGHEICSAHPTCTTCLSHTCGPDLEPNITAADLCIHNNGDQPSYLHHLDQQCCCSQTDMLCNPIAPHSQQGPQQCKGDRATFDAGWGNCESYAIHCASNHYYCSEDMEMEAGSPNHGFLAQEVCSECEHCTDGSR